MAYSQLRKANKNLLENFNSAFNIPIELQSSANRSLMSIKIVESVQQLSDMGLRESCRASCAFFQPIPSVYIFRFAKSIACSWNILKSLPFLGHVTKIILKFAMRQYPMWVALLKWLLIKQTIILFQPDHFLLCHYHARQFKIFYHLRHMDWNVHWNCRLRVCYLIANNSALFEYIFLFPGIPTISCKTGLNSCRNYECIGSKSVHGEMNQN